ncbi:hypothetical protein [Actinokineospora enzanensis]|uniref:hypothetical protein n=1 Tax=Actinokineospora enzanensis TaxID=155975 RepID=UPI00037AB63D|nr:hypothetical protein [Actinokineospora enzanensis]
MSSPNNDSLGFLCGLTAVFVVLKVTGNLAWSWTWVTSPLWIVLAFGIGYAIATHRD